MASERLPSRAVLSGRVLDLERQLEESKDALEAIRRGEVDAVVVNQRPEHYGLYTLQSADHPYRILIEQIQEGVVTLTEEGTVLYCNRHVATMLETPMDRVIGQRLQPFLQPDDAIPFARMLSEAKRGAARGEVTLCSATGKQIPAHVSLNFLRDGEASAVLCGMLTDLTEQRNHVLELAAAHARLVTEIAERTKVEDALRHAQKMEAIGALAAGVAHDFNNTLQGIIGALELALDEVGNRTPAQELLNVAIETAMRGSSLTRHLLSYARKQVLRPQAVEVGPILADIQNLLSRSLGRHIEIELRVDQGLFVLADAGLLQTAVLNVAINASHAMPSGGTLTIAAREERDAGQTRVAITLTDTGAGMDEATLRQAVEPFFTTKGLRGTGLGLAMVQGFAEQSNGRLSIVSAPGQGTTVELWLPAAVPGAGAPRPAVSGQAAMRHMPHGHPPKGADLLLDVGYCG